MLYLQDVTINRGSKIVFYNWSAKIENSKITIISGKNGVGKSTLLRAIAGMIPLEKGMVKNFNNEIFKDKVKWGKKLIYIDTKNGLSKDLTVYENLKTWSEMRGWKTNDDDLQRALDSVEMLNHKNLYVSQCSEGLKKRAALSRLYLSLLFDIEFWLLDEPTNELDQKSIILFNKLIQRFLENKGTVLLACHELKLFDFNYELLNLDLLKK